VKLKAKFKTDNVKLTLS